MHHKILISLLFLYLGVNTFERKFNPIFIPKNSSILALSVQLELAGGGVAILQAVRCVGRSQLLVLLKLSGVAMFMTLLLLAL